METTKSKVDSLQLLETIQTPNNNKSPKMRLPRMYQSRGRASRQSSHPGQAAQDSDFTSKTFSSQTSFYNKASHSPNGDATPVTPKAPHSNTNILK